MRCTKRPWHTCLQSAEASAPVERCALPLAACTSSEIGPISDQLLYEVPGERSLRLTIGVIFAVGNPCKRRALQRP